MQHTATKTIPETRPVIFFAFFCAILTGVEHIVSKTTWSNKDMIGLDLSNLTAGFALRALVTTQDRLIGAEKSGIPRFGCGQRIQCFMLHHMGNSREQQDTWQHRSARHDSWCVYWMYSGQFAPRLMHAKDLMSACQAMAIASGSFQPFHLSYNMAEGDHKHWEHYLYDINQKIGRWTHTYCCGFCCCCCCWYRCSYDLRWCCLCSCCGCCCCFCFSCGRGWSSVGAPGHNQHRTVQSFNWSYSAFADLKIAEIKQIECQHLTKLLQTMPSFPASLVR